MDDPTKAIKKARALTDLAERAKALGDLLARDLPAITSQLQAERQAAVVEMHEELGLSYAEIGAEIGQHRTRVAQIAKGVSGGKRKTPGHCR
jgi:DNA-directed RNA polymerase specialized sigma24 family protein